MSIFTVLLAGFLNAPMAAAAPPTPNVPVPCNGNLEAEFIGEIVQVNFTDSEAGSVEHTSYHLGNFKVFQFNQLCPLDQEQAEAYQFWVQGQPQVIEHQVVSGILVYDPRTGLMRVE